MHFTIKYYNKIVHRNLGTDCMTGAGEFFMQGERNMTPKCVSGRSIRMLLNSVWENCNVLWYLDSVNHVVPWADTSLPQTASQSVQLFFAQHIQSDGLRYIKTCRNRLH